MRMLLTAAIAFSASSAVAGEKEDAVHFLALQREFKKRLPASWELKAPLKKGATVDEAPRPMLVLRSKKKLAVVLTPPSSPPPPRGGPPTEQAFVTIELIVEPHVSPMEWARLRSENREKRRRRVAFCRKHFSGMRVADIKSGRLYAPDTLKPATPMQRHHVLEYSFLWLKTVPHNLPSHRYKTLSFNVYRWPRYLHLPVKAQDREYTKVLDLVDSVLTPYIKPPKPAAEGETPDIP